MINIKCHIVEAERLNKRFFSIFFISSILFSSTEKNSICVKIISEEFLEPCKGTPQKITQKTSHIVLSFEEKDWNPPSLTTMDH